MNKLIERDVESLWKKYNKLLAVLQSEGVDKLLEEQGQRIIECSYSQKTSEPYCGIGGLVVLLIKSFPPFWSITTTLLW